MSTKLFIGDDLQDFKTAPKFNPISRVELIVSDEIAYIAGDNSGRTMTLQCPWGSQKIADDLLHSFRGFRYQPFYAGQVPLNPAAEIGDALNVSGVYGGYYGADLDFKGLYAVDASAPSDEELDHEYQFETKQNREYKRQLSGISSELLLQAGEISAKVSKSGGDPGSFSWKLTDSSWDIKANGRSVFEVLDGKSIVHGDIYADGGQIAGLKISRDSLTWNGSDLAGADVDLGGGGSLKAPSGHFGGNTHAGGILHGGDYGNVSGSALALRSVGGAQVATKTLSGGQYGHLKLSTVPPSNLTEGVQNTLSHADTVYNVLFGTTQCTNVNATGSITGNTLAATTNFSFQQHACTWKQVNGVWVISRY